MKGWRQFLDCPECGEEVTTLPAYRANGEFPFPHWIEDDYATCQCGAELFVEADGERAWLVVRESTPPANITPARDPGGKGE